MRSDEFLKWNIRFHFLGILKAFILKLEVDVP
ncbi:MAG: hypothetical protein ACI9P5_004944, partial [Saprospiraceae bacterium]